MPKTVINVVVNKKFPVLLKVRGIFLTFTAFYKVFKEYIFGVVIGIVA